MRRPSRSQALAGLAALCLLGSVAVWLGGGRVAGAMRHDMRTQLHDSLAGQTIELLQGNAATGRLVASILAAGGATEPVQSMLGDFVRRHPNISVILFADTAGRVMFEVHRDPQGVQMFEGGLVVVRTLFSPNAEHHPSNAQEPVLVRTNEAAKSPVMVGVGMDVPRTGPWPAGRIIVLTLAADMPSGGPPIGQTWLIGQDDAVIAEPGAGSGGGQAVPNWGAFREARDAAGSIALPTPSGEQLFLYRRLDPWPVTLVTSLGPVSRPFIRPFQLLAVLLMAAAMPLLWRAHRASRPRQQDLADGIAGTGDREAIARNLAVGIAHELNNVLTVLAFDAEMVATAVPSQSALQILSESMLAATARGTVLTDRLLSYAERAMLRPRPVDLDIELIRQHDRLKAFLRPGQSLQRIAPVPAGASIWVLVDPEGLLVCLGAMLRNAADVAGELDDIKIELHLAPGSGGATALLVVDDPGPGMDDATRLRALEPGFSASQDRRRIGMGLGLSAAAGFARQSGGRLELDSRPGLGTRACLYLPTVADPQGHPAPTGGAIPASESLPGREMAGRAMAGRVMPPSPLVAASRGMGARAKRILLVEDSVQIRDSIARRLRSDGFDVIEAIGVADVLAVVLLGVDVMITDIMLTDANDGWTLGARARELDPSLPLVFMSGFMSSRQPELLAGDELASFVRKPINGAELNMVIAGLLALREARQLQAGQPQSRTA